MQVIESHEADPHNLEDDQELNNEYIEMHANEDVHHQMHQKKDSVTAQFYIYIYDFKNLPMKKYYVQLLCPQLSEKPYYRLKKSDINEKIYRVDIEIPKETSYMKLTFKVILISTKDKAYISSPKAERYDPSLYTCQSTTSSQKNLYVFHTFQTIKNDFKSFKIKDATLYPYTQMACILIEKMYSNPELRQSAQDVEKYLLKGFIKELNSGEIYKSLAKLCRENEGKNST